MTSEQADTDVTPQVPHRARPAWASHPQSYNSEHALATTGRRAWQAARRGLKLSPPPEGATDCKYCGQPLLMSASVEGLYHTGKTRDERCRKKHSTDAFCDPDYPFDFDLDSR